MRMYRLGDSVNADGWPFLYKGHAFLADGTPLTECNTNGRIVPTSLALNRVHKDCCGGNLRLADRRPGIEALARALNDNDPIRASILLLQLQIDKRDDLAKYNHFHKPGGPGGGEFASSPSTRGAIKPIEWDMHVGLNSTYVPGIFGPDMDAAHDKVMAAVRSAMLTVGSLKFRPGMPLYGAALHKAIALEILKLDDPSLVPNPIYLDKDLVTLGRIPAGSSIPDVIYAPGPVPRIIFEFKSGSATDLDSRRNSEQRERTLGNVPGIPLYEYIQVYGN